MSKLIIHMGLSKTATTSLQNNFFLKLHQEGKINFLGKAFGNSQKDYYNALGSIMADLRVGPLSVDKEIELRRRLHEVLSDDKVNLISEESLTVTSDQKHELVYENLERITKGCQVQVLIGLRNPVDFFYSAYVEMYRWKYHEVKGKDTVSKFLDGVCLEPHNSEYDMFFFDRLLKKIKLKFPNIKIYLFEAFKAEKSSLLDILHECFELEKKEMEFIDEMGAENTRTCSDTAKKGEAVTLNQKIVPLVNCIFGKDMRNRLKRLALVREGYRSVLNFTSKVKVTKEPEHAKLTEEQVKRLSETLDLDVNYLVDNFYLNKRDLSKHGYVRVGYASFRKSGQNID